jgi:hypothetical protein
MNKTNRIDRSEAKGWLKEASTHRFEEMKDKRAARAFEHRRLPPITNNAEEKASKIRPKEPLNTVKREGLK